MPAAGPAAPRPGRGAGGCRRDGLEPAVLPAGMLEVARKKAEGLLVSLAETLPFEDETFDTAVSSLSLCTSPIRCAHCARWLGFAGLTAASCCWTTVAATGSVFPPVLEGRRSHEEPRLPLEPRATTTGGGGWPGGLVCEARLLRHLSPDRGRPGEDVRSRKRLNPLSYRCTHTERERAPATPREGHHVA